MTTPALRNKRRDLTDYKPEEVKQTIRKADAVIDYAKDLKDWPLLEQAVDSKVNEIAKFVAWWDENVSPGDSGGRGGRKGISDRKFVPASDAEKATGLTPVQVSRWRSRLSNPDAFHEMLYGPVYRKAFGDARPATTWSADVEWYTPRKYIDAARKVMGGIDLDPASCEIANETVGADRYFHAGCDGLKQEWHGRVWMNPPYCRQAGAFLTKLTEEYKAGRVKAAVCLLSAHCTDTGWFQQLWDGCVCFTNQRIHFYGAEGASSGNIHGSVFGYFGPDECVFAREFEQFGAVVKRIDIASLL